MTLAIKLLKRFSFDREKPYSFNGGNFYVHLVSNDYDINGTNFTDTIEKIDKLKKCSGENNVRY